MKKSRCVSSFKKTLVGKHLISRGDKQQYIKELKNIYLKVIGTY